MIIEVKELCEVDYVGIEDLETDDPTMAIKPKLAIRTVEYESDEETLLEAFKEYENNFDVDKVIDCNDEFDGECLNFVKTLSVKELDCIQRKAVGIIYDIDDKQTTWLPKEVYIPSYIKADEVADYISDITGYLVKGFILEYAEVNKDEQ